MCLGAIYWARPARMVYACDREDASTVGFDDGFIYEELEKHISERHIPTQQLMREEAWKTMQEWTHKKDKTQY